MRQLKFHEKKLLKKVDFLQWKNEHNLRELQVGSRRYFQGRVFREGATSSRATSVTCWAPFHNLNYVPQVMRRYHIQDRDDYKKYNKLVGMVTSLTSVLKKLAPTDPARIELTEKLLDRLHDMGVITTKKSLVQLEKLSTASFCRRRLPVVMVRAKMSETLKEAITFIEQGHVRIGPDTGAGVGWTCACRSHACG